MQKTVTLHIYDTDLVWKGMIEAFGTFVYRRHWNEIVYSELTIERHAQGIEEMHLGRFISVNNDPAKMLIIEEMFTSLEDEFWTFNLVSMNGLLNYRIVLYEDTDDFVDQVQSYVMHALVDQNLTDEFVSDVNRKFLKSDGTTAAFYVAPYTSFGETITFETGASYGYLGDAIIQVSNMHEDTGYPVGWSVTAHSTFSTLRFATQQHVNKTIHQTAVQPVIFSDEFGNVKDIKYTLSTKDWRNCAYLYYGTPETPTRSMVLNYIKFGAAKSFNRREVVLDGKSKTSAGIVKEGKSYLNKHYKVESFSAEIVPNDNTMTTFELDWNIGDIVTIQTTKLSNQLLSLDTQVIGTEEIFENGEYTLNTTFGGGKIPFTKLIKMRY